MITVYDKNGKASTVEGVDAREYVASGEYFFEAPAKKKESAQKDEDTLTADQIKAKLSELKVAIPTNAKKEDLEKLLADNTK